MGRITRRETREEPWVTDRHRDGYVLTSDHSRLEVDRVHARLLQESYGARGRERAVIGRSIARSRPCSAYTREQQTAFARVLMTGHSRLDLRRVRWRESLR